MPDKANTCVIYHSKYGSTRQYADWIAEEIGADLIDANVTDPEDTDLSGYDNIIFGGYIYAGTLTMKLCRFVVDLWDQIEDKRIAIYSVSSLEPWNSRTQTALARSLPGEYRRQLAFFPLWGRVNIGKMRLLDKLVAKMKNMEDMDKVHKDELKSLLKFIRTGKK